ncbi:MAG: hypothetical protein AAI978_00740 [Candidatus Hodgkinia cicadicola]
MHSCGYNTAAVEFEPLAKGMGQTVANALRRTLLTEISGWALVGVYIDGANHELDKLVGVKEDALDVVLNLKQLVFGGDRDDYVIKGVLSANASGDVLAYGVCLPEGMRLFNPNQRICYLNSGFKFRAELVIAHGVGYVKAETARAGLGSILNGYIALDANFSPIKRVSYKVIESEYNPANYDKVSMLIESNGAVDLRVTIISACELLYNQFVNLAEALQ